ncbi:competence protein CoiA [Staphylococcus pettenkoferi]|uniref:Competence protein CoiA family protein n=1 Tax=Staphylococcus pettenkoferi TaxID=170573 RepID=A0A9Q4GYQ7_9STAP|nr:competence protein CoiA family protein [Staphylococcus pettenkoferi]MCY1568587.1 competence protein CoiA family protein [Staphylococcus pettenkoferi]MCY1575628.1 competence protein CoiA family protein [Staphylococcus pettenkoferi]MCY1593665.1 competence protein CoiA family protein [Staphylococcus pettenkoferi]MCY1617964.1 competence protein CoiA family protein [Staphylococcus pettenkoferi]
MFAFNAMRGERYCCPDCRGTVIFRRGTKVKPHFAHKVKSVCLNNSSESMAHYNAKYVLAQQLVQKGYYVEVEQPVAQIQQRPDLIVDHTYAIEIQFSSIPLEVLQARTTGLEDQGYEVIWIVLEPKTYQRRMKLQQLQSACLNPVTRRLIAWSDQHQSLVGISEIQYIGGQWFVGNKRPMTVDELFCKSEEAATTNLYKLSDRRVERYIQMCRRQNNVHEPTLNAMYHLQWSQRQVNSMPGFILPHQLYIRTHPVAWQLQYCYMQKLEVAPSQYTHGLFQFRHFIHAIPNCQEIEEQLIDGYRSVIQNVIMEE